MSQSKEKIRVFQKYWQKEYFCIENNGLPQCLICNKTFNYNKKSNLEYHFNHEHISYINMYKTLTKLEINTFKEKEFFKLQKHFKQNDINKFLDNINIFENKKHLLASYKISYLIAKNLKSYSEGEFLHDVFTTTCSSLFPNNPEIKNFFKKIPLSSRSITKKINIIPENIKNSLKVFCKSFEKYSLCLDESNDLADFKQLVVFIRGIETNYTITEESLDLVHLQKSSTGSEIFTNLLTILHNFDLNLNNLVSITTDKAKNLLSVKKGLIAHLNSYMSDNKIKNTVINFHCLLHQENLCIKNLEFKNIIELVIEIVSKLKKYGNTHKFFRIYLSEINSYYKDNLPTINKKT